MKYDISKIRALIAENGMNETDFLHSVGLGAKTLTRLESGSELPREDYISFVALGLKVDVDSLLCDDSLDTKSEKLSPIAKALVNNYHNDSGLLSAIQIGESSYSEWISLVRKLNTCGESLLEDYKDDTFILTSDKRRNYLYQIVKKVFLMVGEINGGKLHAEETTSHTIIEYAWAKKQKEALHGQINLPDNVDAFRFRYERYLARKIIEQQLKSQKMLSDDAEDLLLRKKLRKSLRKQFGQVVEASPVKAEYSNNPTQGDKVTKFAPQDKANISKKQEPKSEKNPEVICQSTILVATLTRIGEIKSGCNLTIVADESEQDSAKNIYWVGRALPAAVLAALQTKDRVLLYKGVRCQVADYVAYKDAEKYLKIISRFANPTSPQTVYVFSHKNVAHFEQNGYELVTAMVPCEGLENPIPVNVYYDKSKQQYFINEVTYTTLREKYGLPYMRLRIATNQGASHWYSNLKPRSELNLLGYTVNVVDSLSTESRRKILRDAIDSGVLWKVEIINHLEWLIKTMENHPNMGNAVSEWKSDLMYISKYQAAEQRRIWISKFKSRFSETCFFE